MPAAPWDLFCRVVDNLGDVGVCWRLAAALARRGQPLRLWIDQPEALAWMAPGGAPGVSVVPWTHTAPELAPGPVVIEAFGCDPPPAFVGAMARRQPAPVWINLEYLSAEVFVERSHRLPSPQFSGPGAGLRKWFFYPGFSRATGGLLHDDGTGTEAQARAWLHQQGWGPEGVDGVGGQAERTLVVFSYANPALPGLLQSLAGQPIRLLVPPGPALAQLAGLHLPAWHRLTALPYLPQTDFDRLLAGADVNLVRGEDSFTRAQLCARSPFLWQVYPQADGAHIAKLEAFLDRYLALPAPPDGTPDATPDPAPAAATAAAVRRAFRAFNGLDSGPWAWPEPTAWRALHAAWRAHLRAQDDLCSQLLRFVASRGATRAGSETG